VRGKKQELIVLLDEGTPILSGDPFLEKGYRVIYHADVLEPSANDEVVAATAILNKAALIAVDLDMRRLVRRFGKPDDNRFKSLDLIFVHCDAVMTAKRVAHAMSFIENEWSVRCEKAARRLWVNIDNHRLTTYR